MQHDDLQEPRLFGRENIIERILQRTEGLPAGFRQNMALIGREGTGKTAVLDRVAHLIQNSRIVVVPLATAPETFRTFAERFIAVLIFKALVKKGIRSTNELDALLLLARTHFPKTHHAIHAVLGLLKTNPTAAFGGLLDLTVQLNTETGWSFVLLLDEFDRIEGYRLRNPFKVFGQKVMLQKQTMYVVTSSRTTRAFTILREKLNLLFGHFELIAFKELDSQNAYALLKAYAGQTTLTPLSAKFLIALTGGHPAYLKSLASGLQTMQGGNFNALLNVLEKQLFNPEGLLHQKFQHEVKKLSHPRHSSIYLPILLSLAQGQHTCAKVTRALKRNRRDVSKQLAQLVQMDLVTHNGQFFWITEACFKFWLVNVFTLRIHQVNPDPEATQALFRTSVRKAFDIFCAAAKRDMADRVVELFTLFQNETIQLNHRPHKLPGFQEVQRPHTGNGVVPIYARKGTGYWASQIANGHMTDTQVTDFSTTCKKSCLPIKRKLIISQKPLNPNASLVAKEEKIWTWDLTDLNLLLDLHGQPPVIL